MRQLQDNNGSAQVTLPKEKLAADGVLDDGCVPDEQGVRIEQVGRRSYLVRIPDGGDLPDLRDTDIVQREAARLKLTPPAADGGRAD